MSAIDVTAGILAGERMLDNLSPPMVAAVSEAVVPLPTPSTIAPSTLQSQSTDNAADSLSIKSDRASVRRVSASHAAADRPSSLVLSEDAYLVDDDRQQREAPDAPQSSALPIPAATHSKAPSLAGTTTKHLQLLDDDSEELGCRVLSRYTLYETRTRYYITASSADRHKILKIDRTTAASSSSSGVGASGSGDPSNSSSRVAEELSIVEDAASYDQKQLETLLRMVDDGNKSMGGLEKVLDFHGIIGFVSFTSGYYMILCTKRSVVGLIGGHYIFHCDETIMLPISNKMEKTAEETKLLNMFQGVDLSKNFYFSYSYDLTNTLQVNLTRPVSHPVYNVHFMWNFHLLRAAFGLREPDQARPESDPAEADDTSQADAGKYSRWVLPLIHGFVDQAKIPVLGRTVYTTVIARRSRQHAGTRYLKRGVNEKGYVANEVETEQIVSEPMVTAFHTLGKGKYANYTSFVQVRGSIPLHWTQDTTNMSPRPPIEISVVDPFYSAAAKHFSNLLDRYGAPIVVVNLIKSKESLPRESKLLDPYSECISYLNQFLPADEPNKRIKYIAWDMAQATKSKTQDVIGIIEDIAEEAIQLTGFFHGGHEIQLQNGIMRTNCIDCLDRTNAFQFAASKVAFSHQVHALGIIPNPELSFDSDAIDMLIELWSDHGDTIAFQYTGSALVNRVETYRRTKTRQWSSHSRDLLENMKRYYNNSLLDADKQAAMDLFLGVNTTAEAATRDRPPERLHYQHWYDPCALEEPSSLPVAEVAQVRDDIWTEYYKPHLLSQFQRLYTFTMNSTSKTALRSSASAGVAMSPFQSRIQAKNAQRQRRKSFRIPLVPMPQLEAPNIRSHRQTQSRSLVHPSGEDKSAAGLEGPLVSLVTSLLEPTMSDTKRQEYEWYTLYQTNELLSSADTVEPQDLQLYSEVAEIARGNHRDLDDATTETVPVARSNDWQMPLLSGGNHSSSAMMMTTNGSSAWPSTVDVGAPSSGGGLRVKPSDVKVYEAFLSPAEGFP